MNKCSRQSGFSLIEVLIYILLITFILGSIVLIAFHLLQNSDNLRQGIRVEEEANFILQKISWALNDSYQIDIPALNSEANNLVLYKNNFGSDNPIRMDLISGAVVLTRGGNTAKQINNDRFEVTNLIFNRMWDGFNTDTDIIRASFEIDGRLFQITRKIR